MLAEYKALLRQRNIHPEAKWEEATLPYVLAEDVTLNEYEHRTDEFNVHGLWEWTNYKVSGCSDVDDTDSRIMSCGSTRTRADGCGKEADAPFRPKKSGVPAPTGSDGKRKPWIIVEVAFSESIDHVLNKVKNYWLKDLSRAHDAIIVKIDLVSEDEAPSRMQTEEYEEETFNIELTLCRI
ncbi:2911_t:CDS:2 [Ambispora gerdemannii]|uniref:2911_t:CDS:1 n=1 Tax=Ambispora gerdemannii TaxID=144530 RepID=A0A9N8WTA4_9GLOM|nr:2911_t:CDS:2 [Ambispora gerdemannii]